MPAQPEHSALTSEYAHVTAPLRRLVDRYTGEICVALCAGEEVPGWVRAAMPDLPQEMAESSRLANRYENAILDLVETGVLQRQVGQEFAAVVVEVDHRDERRGTVTVQEPAVEAPVHGERRLPLGSDVRVRLEKADLASRDVEFRLV